MVELRFRIRNNVFNVQDPPKRATIRPLSLCFPSVEEAALLGEVDETGRVTPRKGVFFLSFLRTGPVIDGFEDCALGEFVKAQLEALSQDGEPPAKCEVHGCSHDRGRQHLVETADGIAYLVREGHEGDDLIAAHSSGLVDFHRVQAFEHNMTRAPSSGFRKIGTTATCVVASRGGMTIPLSSPCTMIMAPIIRVVSPQLVA